MGVHSARGDRARCAVLAAAAMAGLTVLTIAPADAATSTVTAVNFQFEPASRTVNAGDVVRWTFAGDPHTVTSGTPGAPDGRFDSGIKDPGGSFQVTFDRAGTFRYFCQIHPEQMFGMVVVRAAATPTPTPRPTPKASPTPRSTPKPTVKPTARPTATPTPLTSQPSSAPPTATPSTPPTVAPTTSATASPSTTPAGSSSGPSAGVSPSPTTAPDDSTAGLDPAAILAGAIVLSLLVAGVMAMARRAGRA